jgi:hypothetical protein
MCSAFTKGTGPGRGTLVVFSSPHGSVDFVVVANARRGVEIVDLYEIDSNRRKERRIIVGLAGIRFGDSIHVWSTLRVVDDRDIKRRGLSRDR